MISRMRGGLRALDGALRRAQMSTSRWAMPSDPTKVPRLAPPAARPSVRAGDLPHCKVCDLADFQHPEYQAVAREVFPHELTRFGASYPEGVEYRKHWEIVMAVRALRAAGALRPDAEVLGVGAGNEPTIFWLTNHVRRVFATDLYLAGAWAESANARMLIDASGQWPGPWNPRRLVAQHMNALDLKYEDETFDAVFSSSSIEHFGEHADVRRSVDEIFRVLKPGGVLSVATEYRLAGPSPGMPGVLMFDRDELLDLVVGTRGWSLLGELDLSVSSETLASVCPEAEAIADVERHVLRHGELRFHELDWSRYPMLALERGPLRWTSVHLALQKHR
jgi:SAM-dependent methyltransferase